MTTIKASCPSCGDVELTPQQVRLVVCSVKSWSYYAFTCTTCQDEVRKPAGRDVVALLISGGVVAEPWNVPAEALEEHSGAALSYDDVLDFVSTEAKLGKPVANDLREGKLTLPLIYLLELGDAAHRRAVETVVTEGAIESITRDAILSLVVEHGTLDRARAEAQRYAELATAALGEFPDSEFRDALLKNVFEVLSRVSGINFVFDRDVRADLRTTIMVRDTPLEEALQFLLVTNQLDKKILNQNTILIYPNQPNKLRDYQELVTRSFYLGNADVKQTLNLVKTVLKTRDVFIDERLNLLVMRDTPDAIRLAEKLIAAQDLAEPEVILEMKVLEITRQLHHRRSSTSLQSQPFDVDLGDDGLQDRALEHDLHRACWVGHPEQL